MDRWTLDDYLIHLFQTHQYESVEFQCLLRIYGYERIKVAYIKYKTDPPSKNYEISEIPQKSQISIPKARFSRFHPLDD